ncbi:MAG TPA: 2-C-methyl-D-erythritol 4-phosphate cytidylyltransferase [Streptosporangiaceae bacterium]|jgi:2-C-methyl-D-erythritol 4-phosphate cytidylyltransferase
MRTVAVVLAGGTGTRFGGDKPKQLHLLAGKPLIEHSVAAFQQAPGIDEILLVLAADYAGQVRSQLAAGQYGKVTGVIEGGVARADSTRCAIEALGDAECNVLLHDAARPLVDQRIIAGCVAALQTAEAVGVAAATTDTIVVVSDGVMTGIPPRETLRRCQTPQGFRLSVLRKAHQLALADPGFTGAAATDDCGVVLRYLPGVPVRVVPGSERNIKITYPADLDVAELLLRTEPG